MLDFKNISVLVLGDSMLDVSHYGTVSRMSPEFPVPVFCPENSEKSLGGAGNVAMNIARLGAAVSLISVVGEDISGDEIIRFAENNDINCAGMIKSQRRRTTVKHRIIGNNKQIVRIDEEDTADLFDEEERMLKKKLEKALSMHNPDIIILQDYNKGVLSLPVIKFVLKLAKEHGVKVCVDPKKKNFEAYDGVDLFKPNVKEFRDYLRVNNIEAEELREAVVKFQKRHKIDKFLLTMAEKGLIMSTLRGDFFHFPARKCDIIDVSGAGDAVIAAAALCIAAGYPEDKVAYISNVAGGLSCERHNVSPISIDDLTIKLDNFR